MLTNDLVAVLLLSAAASLASAASYPHVQDGGYKGSMRQGGDYKGSVRLDTPFPPSSKLTPKKPTTDQPFVWERRELPETPQVRFSGDNQQQSTKPAMNATPMTLHLPQGGGAQTTTVIEQLVIPYSLPSQFATLQSTSTVTERDSPGRSLGQQQSVAIDTGATHVLSRPQYPYPSSSYPVSSSSHSSTISSTGGSSTIIDTQSSGKPESHVAQRAHAAANKTPYKGQYNPNKGTSTSSSSMTASPPTAESPPTSYGNLGPHVVVSPPSTHSSTPEQSPNRPAISLPTISMSVSPALPSDSNNKSRREKSEKSQSGSRSFGGSLFSRKKQPVGAPDVEVSRPTLTPSTLTSFNGLNPAPRGASTSSSYDYSAFLSESVKVFIKDGRYYPLLEPYALNALSMEDWRRNAGDLVNWSPAGESRQQGLLALVLYRLGFYLQEKYRTMNSMHPHCVPADQAVFPGHVHCGLRELPLLAVFAMIVGNGLTVQKGVQAYISDRFKDWEPVKVRSYQRSPDGTLRTNAPIHGATFWTINVGSKCIDTGETSRIIPKSSNVHTNKYPITCVSVRVENYPELLDALGR